MYLVTTNNVLQARKTVLKTLCQNSCSKDKERDICIFLNSTDTIEAIIKQLEITSESTVFCSEKSVKKLNQRGFKSAYEHWDKKKMKKYNFFTSRFYSALDIELDEAIDLVMISDLYYAEHSMIDPNTEAPQIIGRFRKENGVTNIVHITNLKSDLSVRTREELQLYLDCSESIYNKINELHNTTSDLSYRQAYKAALAVIPYSKYIDKNGKKNYFALDNYIDEEMVKRFYNNSRFLLEAYKSSNRFEINYQPASFPLGDFERLQRERDSKSLRERNIETVRQLDLLMESGDYNSETIQEYRNELYKYNKLYVEAYEVIGKEGIIKLNYSRPKIREAMILKKYKDGVSGLGFQELLSNSFVIGKKYTRKFIKEELSRIYSIFEIKPKGKITAETIREYFEAIEVKQKGDAAFQLIARL